MEREREAGDFGVLQQADAFSRFSCFSLACADFPQLFSELKLKHLQAHCRARFGPLAARIFRCLLVHKRLEETQVSEYATAPRKEVRRLLYLMHNSKLLSLQEVPRSSDRMPTKTFFLWGVDVKVATETYRESLYFSWCNLRLRLDQETDAAKPILDKIDTSKPITDQEKAQVEMWKKAADRLEGGIHQLNNLIMLFQDF
jgi:DNA-directed RNA polymerase III subunit RPC3